MKRLLTISLSFIVMLSVFSGCTGSGNAVLPENNYTPHFDEPPYITFKNTDWGMSIEQVLAVLGWEYSDWEDITSEVNAWEGEQWFRRTNVVFQGGYVDVQFTFMKNGKLFVDEPNQNIGLVEVAVFFHDDKAIEAAIDYMNSSYGISEEFPSTAWGYGFTNGDHPSFEIIAQKTFVHSWHEPYRDERMVFVRFGTLTRDERGIALLHFIAFDGALLNNIAAPVESAAQEETEGKEESTAETSISEIDIVEEAIEKVSPEEIRELLESIPHPGIDIGRSLFSAPNPIAVDETGIEIAGFISGINGWWGPPSASFYSPDQAEPGFVSPASFWATNWLRWDNPDSMADSKYHPELHVLIPYLDLNRADNTIILHNHIEETATQLFGQKLEMQPRFSANIDIYEFSGVYAYSLRPFGVVEIYTPIILYYEDIGDGYKVTTVFVWDVGGVFYSEDTWEEIPEDELIDYLHTVPGRHTITLKRNQDGGFYYWAHILPAAPLTLAPAQVTDFQVGAPTFELGTESSTPTRVGFAGYEWLAISRHHDTLALLARNDDFGSTAFGDGHTRRVVLENSFAYIGGMLHQAMQSIHSGITNANERELVQARTIDVKGNGADTVWLTGQYFWPLSLSEVRALYSDDVRSFPLTTMGLQRPPYWWLRSPGSRDFNAAFVDFKGTISFGGASTSGNYAVRPAFHMNLESIIFTSIVASEYTTFTPAADRGGYTKNFTVEHTEQRLNIIATTAQSTQTAQTLAFSYTNATTGTNQHIAAMMTQGDNVTHFHSITVRSSSGELQIPLTNVDDGVYTLKIFSLQVNGNNFTDFASTPVTMSVTVSGGIGTVDNFDGTVLSITSFILAETTGTIDEGARTIAVTVPCSINITNLTPAITHTGVSISPTEAQDFTNPVTYTITAQDGTTRDYTVIVTVLSGSKSITSFILAEATGAIGEDEGTIAVTVPYGTNVTNLTPTITHTGPSINPTGAQDFTNPVTYIVTAQDGTTKGYTVTVAVSNDPHEQWINAEMAAELMQSANADEQNFARSYHDGRYGVRAAAWANFAGLRFEHNTTDSRGVQVRVIIQNPSQMSEDMLVSAWISGNDANRVRNIFKRWFINPVRVVHFDHIGEWGQTVRVSARVDLTGVDVDNLYFYNYNREANTFRRIAESNHRIDANGFLWFNSDMGGSVIISDGPLMRR